MSTSGATARATAGIHHVTAIASDPQQNLNFYEGILGLRLVKKTVNFDDPGTYHLYYGDDVGHPGTILTFFPWAGVPKGRRGTGQVAAISFAVPEGAMDYWEDRLGHHGVSFEGPAERFGERVISFEDPDGLGLELVSSAEAGDLPYWKEGPIPAGHAIRGFHSVTLWERDYEKTARLMTEVLGFELVEDAGSRFRYSAGERGAGHLVDILSVSDGRQGLTAAGTVHHIAWRAADDGEQVAWRDEVSSRGFDVTPVMDRQYFRSIYFREPGGVLFERATDPPGFAIDEDAEHLGEELKLPPWLERRRGQLEEVLPPLRLPRLQDQSEKLAREQKKLGFEHRFVSGDEAMGSTLLLLHGTGGDENDLLPLGADLLPGASLLSPRGKVLEHGMPRFFKRLSEGVFDEEDLKFRTGELAEFVEESAGKYGFEPKELFAVGFSNGANIAAGLLLLRPELLGGAVLFRPMVPFEPEELPDLSGIPVYIGAGEVDQIVPRENTERLTWALGGSRS